MSTQRWIITHDADSVAIALSPLDAGEMVGAVTLLEAIPAGHKFALKAIATGDAIQKLGHSIGRAKSDIAAGTHVHDHVLEFAGRTDRSSIGTDIRAVPEKQASFDGYVRANSRVGTRNYIGILTTVNCSATVARQIAAHFTPERLSAFPAVDGVVAFTHMSGCGMAKSGRGMDNLRRTIAGYAEHPNFAAVLIIGLGCEVNQIDGVLKTSGLSLSGTLQTLTIQDSGGTRESINAGIAMVQHMLPKANQCKRETVSAAHLCVGLQCGASDGYSALTANPALGVATDRVVGAGGKAILSETPEIFGAEDLLLCRAANAEVAGRLIDRLSWWEDYAAQDGASLDNNPSPGNKTGGITTILEKSLGAVAKAGSSPLNAVIDYAETVTAHGLTFMDSPGYDPCSATGQIAGGANLILFTTGRGSVFGSIPAPTIKLASNAVLAAKMADDIDIDCSAVLDGKNLTDMGEEIFQTILSVASGHQTASERNGIGENEWVPWVPGAIF
jgi:altronate hydrolase